MVHYELGNEDMVINLCQSYLRHFEKQKRQHKAEQLLLNFFGKIIHTNPAKEQTDSNKQERMNE